jgi:hypothetical protein
MIERIQLRLHGPNPFTESEKFRVGGFKKRFDMPFGKDQGMTLSYRESIPNGKSQFVFP